MLVFFSYLSFELVFFYTSVAHSPFQKFRYFSSKSFFLLKFGYDLVC